MNGFQGATNADDLKLIATNACRLVCVVLTFCAQKRSYGKKMPKDFDSSLQDLVKYMFGATFHLWFVTYLRLSKYACRCKQLRAEIRSIFARCSCRRD